MYPNIANFIRKYASTSQIKWKTRGAGVGLVDSKLYAKLTSGGAVQLWPDEVRASALNVGAKNGATVSVAEYGFGGFLHQTVFTLTALPLTLADATVGAGVKIYDFPLGAITILGATGSVAETTTSAIASTLNSGVTYNWGVGTVTQANGVLATTEQDIIPTSNGTSSTTINVAAAASPGIRVAAPANFNGTSTAIDAYFNVGIATATDIDADATTEWTGTLSVIWLFSPDV